MTAAELEPHYEKAYRDAQPEIQIQGFRKGKVPIHLIKKNFGKAIEANAVEDIATEVFRNVLEEHKIEPVGQPALRDVQRESDGSLGFSISYEVMPEFELQNYRNIEVEKLIFNVTEEDIDKEIERLMLERASLEDAEQITDEMHFVVVRLNPIDAATGMPLIGGKSEEVRTFLKNEPSKSEFKASVMNLKVGDSFRFTPPSKDANALSAPVLATVQEIKRVVPAEFTNAFVEEITQGQLTSTEDLRRDMEKQMRDARESSIKSLMDDQLVQKILESHDFEPPQGLISQVVASMLQEDVQRLPDKKLPKGFDVRAYAESRTPIARNTAKWMLIRERIIDEENIEISEDDINKQVEELTAMMNLPEANVEYMRSAIAGDEQLQSRLMHEKLMDVLRGYAVITEKEFDRAAAEAAQLAEEMA
ncbi:MAG: trigger factor [Candidatus Kapabacteria bacterium]|nr:trigger factor [Candidatus Kapabacteria bacterium]